LTAAALRTFLRRAEAMSISGAEGHWALIPPALAKRLRSRVLRVGDGLLTMLAGSDALQMNRVIGLGHRGRAHEPILDEIISIFRSARVRLFGVLLSPGPQAEAIERWLRKRGFRRDGGHAMLVRDCARPVPSVSTELRVERALRSDAPAMVRIIQQTFGIPESRRAWSLAGATSARYEPYLAYRGRTPVAVASLRIEDDLAWLGGAGTLTRWRRHGAQSALIAARLRRAARAGCRWAWVETAIPEPRRPGGSRRNLLRMGFEEVCEKPQWVWTRR
jgi:hypothetical protein